VREGGREGGSARAEVSCASCLSACLCRSLALARSLRSRALCPPPGVGGGSVQQQVCADANGWHTRTHAAPSPSLPRRTHRRTPRRAPLAPPPPPSLPPPVPARAGVALVPARHWHGGARAQADRLDARAAPRGRAAGRRAAGRPRLDARLGAAAGPRGYRVGRAQRLDRARGLQPAGRADPRARGGARDQGALLARGQGRLSRVVRPRAVGRARGLGRAARALRGLDADSLGLVLRALEQAMPQRPPLAPPGL
jgi:hypothetical protein